MTDRPILFSAPMVRALLDGRKTQTRRILKPQPPAVEEVHKLSGASYAWMPPERGLPWRVAGPVWAVRQIMGAEPTLKVRFKVGDRLYVREHWRSWRWNDDLSPAAMPKAWADRPTEYVSYVADNDDRMDGRFRQGMHMPRWASRLTLTVSDVRVERLQAISEADAIAEGIAKDHAVGMPSVWGWRDYLRGSDIAKRHYSDPRESYRTLWDHINGAGAWARNDWVVAVTFTPERRNIDA